LPPRWASNSDFTQWNMGLYEKLRDAIQQGKGMALATVVAGPRDVGAKMLVGPGDEADGQLISPATAATVFEDAVRMLREERTDILEYETEQGKFEVFIESFPAPAQLLIVGAGHVAEALSRLGKMLSYYVIVTDARGAFAVPERFPDANRVIKGWPQDVLPKLDLGEKTYLVLLSHDARFDQPTLELALPSPVPYIGAIGSRRTQAERFQRLREQGFTEEQLDRIHGPVGLDIGGTTPEETALAIMAEITAVRRGRSGAPLTTSRQGVDAMNVSHNTP
jgi:xanthine dehydrogenase accessory factor